MSEALFTTRLKKVECIDKGKESGEGIEFYAGQQLTMDDPESNEKLVIQSFTIGTKTKEGYKIKEGEFMIMNDLELIARLPAVESGKQRIFTSRFYAFENDGEEDIIKIKNAFSNDLISFVTANAKEENEDTAEKALQDFLQTENLANFGVAAEFQPIPLAVFNLVNGLVKGLFNNEDDIIGSNIFRILYQANSQGKLEYRIDFGDGFKETFTGEQVIDREITLTGANEGTKIKCTFQLQFIPFD